MKRFVGWIKPIKAKKQIFQHLIMMLLNHILKIKVTLIIPNSKVSKINSIVKQICLAEKLLPHI